MRLAILALGASLKQYPGKGGDQYKNPYDQVWALNGMAFFPDCQDIDRLYVMDDLVYRLPVYSGEELAKSLQKYEKRIITSRVYNDWPTAERFPIEDCVEEFGLPLGIAMYSSPDYMIAHALMDGFTSIDLFGVDNLDKVAPEMTSSTAKWIGVAQSRGVTVNTFQGSHHQYHCSNAIAMEYGLYGYAFKPRIETLAFPDDEFIEVVKDDTNGYTAGHIKWPAQSGT